MKKKNIVASLAPVVTMHQNNPFVLVEIILSWLDARGLIETGIDEDGDAVYLEVK